MGEPFLESFAWRKLRMVVIKKRGARCECCGASPKKGAVIQVDHIKPRHKYPELALLESNLQVLCQTCNMGKGAWDETDWRTVSTESRRAKPRRTQEWLDNRRPEAWPELSELRALSDYWN
jgi:5-methylcytosine-specific restriction endonuclease McrA